MAMIDNAHHFDVDIPMKRRDTMYPDSSPYHKDRISSYPNHEGANFGIDV